MSRFSPLVLTAAAVAGLAFGPTEALTQEPLSRTQYGIGYVVNAPDMMGGGSVYVLSPRWGGIGLYADVKLDISSPTGDNGYDADATSAEVSRSSDAILRESWESWKSVSLALIRPLSPSFMFYVGGGLSRVSYFDLYNVGLQSPYGYGGIALVENPAAEQTVGNLIFGVMTRLSSRITTQFGYETQPDGVTVGVSLRLPAW